MITVCIEVLGITGQSLRLPIYLMVLCISIPRGQDAILLKKKLNKHYIYQQVNHDCTITQEHKEIQMVQKWKWHEAHNSSWLLSVLRCWVLLVSLWDYQATLWWFASVYLATQWTLKSKLNKSSIIIFSFEFSIAGKGNEQ